MLFVPVKVLHVKSLFAPSSGGIDGNAAVKIVVEKRVALYSEGCTYESICAVDLFLVVCKIESNDDEIGSRLFHCEAGNRKVSKSISEQRAVD